MAHWFEIKQSTNELFYFTLKAGNGEVILFSEMYTTKLGAELGIASVQANAPNSDRYDRVIASDGKFYFYLKATNHQVIGTSQMYASESSRDAGIASVSTNGATTDIRDIS